MDAYEEIEWRETCSGDEELIADDELEDSYLSRYITGRFSLTTDVIPTETNFKERPKNPNQLPKIPGSQFPYKLSRKSCFNVKEQASLINALKIIKSGRKNINFFEKHDIDLYNNVKPKILAENKQFMTCAESAWKGNFGKKPLRIKASVKNYATTRRMHRLKRVLSIHPFYKAINLLPFSYREDEDIPIEMVHTANVLDVGKVAKFLPPTMKEHFSLKVITLPAMEPSPIVSSKMPVSEDKNVDSILNHHKVHVVITFSALKRLINFTDVSQRWDIPVVIKEIPCRDNKGQTTMVTVVYIEKPLPQLQPTILDLNENCTKQMMKTNFCCAEAFTYESEDIAVPPSDTEESSKPVTKESSETAEEESSDEGESVIAVNQRVPFKPQIIRNRFYKLWSLKPKEEESHTLMKQKMGNREIGVLIRGKIDGCEVNEKGTLQAITVIPKMEFQLSFGGCIFTKKELANHWTQLYFKPYSNLYRARTHNFSGEVITIEPCNMDRVKSEAAAHHNYKPQMGLGVLYKMFYELMKYPAGKYIMKHEAKHGAFIALYKEVNDEESCDFNLHKTYESDAKIVDDYLKPWIPIDPMVLLPKYELDGHMPALFKPLPLPVSKLPLNKHQKRIKNMKSKYLGLIEGLSG